MLKGIAASAGISIARVYKLEAPKVEIVKKEGDPAAEVEKFNAALEKTKKDIEGVKERAAKRLSEEELAVFDAHLMMAGDPEFASQIVNMIETDKVNAEYAADAVATQMVTMFESMDNDYFRERAADIKDVTFRCQGLRDGHRRQDEPFRHHGELSGDPGSRRLRRRDPERGCAGRSDDPRCGRWQCDHQPG